MFKARMLPAVLALALSLCLVSSAEARKWRWWKFGGIIDGLIASCQLQAAEFQNFPFAAITDVVSPDDAQRSALEALRASAAAAAERLSAECPRDEQAPPSARLEAAEQAIDTTTSSFAVVEPSLRAFYAALDDEQKSRLLREFWEGESRGQRAERRKYSGVARGREIDFWAGVCENLASALRGWPIREIERGVRLSEPQRLALHELVTTSLKTADTLAGACPAETALTPVGRMKMMQARLSALRQAITDTRPAFTHFYEALDQGQKVRFAAIH
jgi:LTXXQ motif family protein